MRGTMLILRPHEARPEVKQFARAPTLDELKTAIGGGYLEAIPGFFSIGYGGTVMNCVAMCDEDGKRRKLAINDAATIAWEHALRRQGSTLLTRDGTTTDHLVGNVIVLFGDREFTEAL